MGATEETRKATEGTGRVEREWRPDPAVEFALRRSVERAQGNLVGYLERKRLYEDAQTEARDARASELAEAKYGRYVGDLSRAEWARIYAEVDAET